MLTRRNLIGLFGAVVALAGGPFMPVAAQDSAPDGICCAEPSKNPQSDRKPSARAKTNHTNVVMDFEGLEDLETVEEFYDGGLGGNGSGPGPDFGVIFSPNAQAIIDSDAGGSGNFGGEPSPDTILFFLTGTAATMNVPDGFTDGFSFFYSAINEPGEIVVYDGLDGTGNVLATLQLPLTPNLGDPDPTGNFSPLEPIGVSFSGTARSVDFGGTIDQIGFDDITLGSETPGQVDDPDPDPAPADTPANIPIFWGGGLAILVGVLGLMGVFRLRR